MMYLVHADILNTLNIYRRNLRRNIKLKTKHTNNFHFGLKKKTHFTSKGILNYFIILAIIQSNLPDFHSELNQRDREKGILPCLECII